ncbi:unnamed protein product [Rotaria socialis]|uniref:Uncharacterized protein n=1 Tax=Rotaria socialis TaxID=392032 RepID=A0A820TRD8_9BILA|nr:unnamed protein product [Rotaria socialis]CAF4708502.1 unnamed protein product [Rotaria socialis]
MPVIVIYHHHTPKRATTTTNDGRPGWPFNSISLANDRAVGGGGGHPGRTFRPPDPVAYSREYAGKSPYPAGKQRKSLEHGSSIPVKNTAGLFRRIPAKFRCFPAGIDRKSPEKM